MPPAAGTARDDLIRRFLPSVRRIADRHVRRVKSREGIADDIYSAGLEGLVRGVNRYDPRRGDTWAYLSRSIEGGILDYLRDQDPLSRDYRRKAKETGVEAWSRPRSLDSTIISSGGGMRGRKLTLLDLLADAGEPVDVTIEHWQEAVAVNRAVRCLPARTQAILRLYYADELTQEAIGAIYGITESKVCQVIHEAHARIKHALA
jgi:RNA polymerase sigma factor for flagellar operon FliA